MTYETILYEEDGPVGTLTLNRPEDGNMFTPVMCREVCLCIEAIQARSSIFAEEAFLRSRLTRTP